MIYYYLLLFRLRCCADRGGDIYNLSNSLSKHGNPQAPTSGDTGTIVIEEMRNMSQKVFRIFKTQFIDNKKNIFDEIEKLTIKNVSGNYFESINSKIDSDNAKSIEKKLFQVKSRMKAFIIYQLGNTIISSGIGCGYYDTSGNKDEKGISHLVNDYLFSYCFNPQKNENNYKHFLDYLLINLSNTIGISDNHEYTPHISEFTKVLEKGQLTVYWQEHSDAIKSNEFEKENRKIFTGNCVISYAKYLEATYKVLDELIKK